MYSREEKRPVTMHRSTCIGMRLIMNVYPPQEHTWKNRESTEKHKQGVKKRTWLNNSKRTYHIKV